jgi:hypothetical protein
MQKREQCAQLRYQYQDVAGVLQIAVDPGAPVIGLREVEMKPSRPHDGHSSSTEERSSFASTETHWGGARECQFSTETRSVHSDMLLSAQCSAKRLEPLW